ncbi:MAG: P1 family peptidase [Gemmatimonadales bacterium]
MSPAATRKPPPPGRAGFALVEVMIAMVVTAVAVLGLGIVMVRTARMGTASAGSVYRSRVARRAGLGVGRMGGLGEDSSGDIFLAFSTANPRAAADTAAVVVTLLPNDRINPVFEATVAATEEAIVNAMLAGETMTGADGCELSAIRYPLSAIRADAAGLGSPKRRSSRSSSTARVVRILLTSPSRSSTRASRSRTRDSAVRLLDSATRARSSADFASARADLARDLVLCSWICWMRSHTNAMAASVRESRV